MAFIEAPTFQADTRAPWHFKGKSNRGFRSSGQVQTVLAHVTDVRGGFGVGKSAVKRHGGDERAARIERYGGTGMQRRGTPYHYIYSPQDVTLVAVWHPRLYSYHGNGANKYSVGFAIDAAMPEDNISSELIGEAFRQMVAHMGGLGYDELEYVEAHRQHSGQRETDPGAQVWQAVESAARELKIYARPEHTTNSRRSGPGRPLPPEWRPSPEPACGTINA